MITFETYRNGNVWKENEKNTNDTHLKCHQNVVTQTATVRSAYHSPSANGFDRAQGTFVMSTYNR